MSVGVAVFLFVLLILVALAGASFFRHKLTALLVLLTLPTGLVSWTLLGAGYTLFVIGLLFVCTAVIQTTSDTLAILRTAKRTNRRGAPALAPRRAQRALSDRSRIAA